jgi:endonuclease/exonuclease/phosphatase family metal-dependent hydrolase
LPVEVSNGNKSIILFAVWAQVDKNRKYTVQTLDAIEYYKLDNMKSPIVFIGDFNSNHIWNNIYKRNDHLGIVQALDKHNIGNIFNRFHSIDDEKNFPTFCSNKKMLFHIDYCFASKDLSVKKENGFKIPKFDEWKTLSDHCPLIVDFDWS